MHENLTTLMVLAACLAVMVAGKEHILKSFEYYSSPLDWCEKNHVHSEHIVEFWNSLTSCLLAVVGALGYVVYGKNNKLYKVEPQMHLVWAWMIIVGVGSVWFHGTLSIAGQISDEVPIVVLAIVAIMLARPKRHWSGRSREIALNTHTLVRAFSAFMVFCLFYPVASHIFTLFGFPFISYFFLTDYAKSKNPQFKKLFWTAILTFSLAFASWITDRVACDAMTEFGEKYLWGYPQLHAVWHVFMSMTFWIIVALGIAIRSETDGFQFSIEQNHGVFPIVHVLV